MRTEASIGLNALATGWRPKWDAFTVTYTVMYLVYNPAALFGVIWLANNHPLFDNVALTWFVGVSVVTAISLIIHGIARKFCR